MANLTKLNEKTAWDFIVNKGHAVVVLISRKTGEALTYRVEYHRDTHDKTDYYTVKTAMTSDKRDEHHLGLISSHSIQAGTPRLVMSCQSVYYHTHTYVLAFQYFLDSVCCGLRAPALEVYGS